MVTPSTNVPMTSAPVAVAATEQAPAPASPPGIDPMIPLAAVGVALVLLAIAGTLVTRLRS